MYEYVWELSEKCLKQMESALKWNEAYAPDYVWCKLTDLNDAMRGYVLVVDLDTAEQHIFRKCVWESLEPIGPRKVYDFATGEIATELY